MDYASDSCIRCLCRRLLACYQVTGDWLAPGSAVEGHLGYVAIVTGAFGAVCGIASLLFISPDDE